jgi:hypothetical protein
MSRTGSRSARVVHVMTPPGAVAALIDPADQHSAPHHAAPAGGEGMTGSRYRLPPAGSTGPDERDAPHDNPTGACTTTSHVFPALNSMPPAPASRPSGRSAVELRPSPDPDASPRCARTPADKTKNKVSTPLDRPRSFRDDVQR